MKTWWNPVEAQDWLATLADTPLTKLMSQAEIATISGHGTVVTYSRKVFIPLTKLCRDVCHYCTFAHRPSQLAAPYLDLDEVLAIARAAGETAPLIFTALFSPFWPEGVFNPIATMSVLIYNFAIMPYEAQIALAWASSFVLVVMILLANLLARWLGRFSST